MSTQTTTDPNAITIPAGETTSTTGSQTFSNTGDGVITGVEPAKTPDQLRAEQAALAGKTQQPGNPDQPNVQTTGARMFSEDEVERFRQQEKEKMYGRVEELSTQL